MVADHQILHLLMACGFGTGMYVPWFDDARMVNGHIVTPYEDLADSIRRCFLPKFRELLPDCEVLVSPLPRPAPKPTRSVFKGRYVLPQQPRILD